MASQQPARLSGAGVLGLLVDAGVLTPLDAVDGDDDEDDEDDEDESASEEDERGPPERARGTAETMPEQTRQHAPGVPPPHAERADRQAEVEPAEKQPHPQHDAVDDAVRRAQRRLLQEWSGMQFTVESTLAAELAELEAECATEREVRAAVVEREASWAAANDRLRHEAAQREAAARDAMSGELDELRGRVVSLQEQLRARDRMLDDLNLLGGGSGAGSGGAGGAGGDGEDGVTWRARAELAQAEAASLRERARALEVSHAPALAAARAERDASQQRCATLERELEQAQLIARGAEGQLARLSSALQVHVAEADEQRAALRAATRRAGDAIDRRVARSWVVTFVEHAHTPRRNEILELMANWWEFTAEDRVRVGLDETNDALYTPNESIADRWVKFLNAEADGAEAGGPAARPRPQTLQGDGVRAGAAGGTAKVG